VRFTPLYGSKSDGLALSSLLELDNFRILLDCGWDENFDVETVEPLRAVAPKVDAVLISHPDLIHLGALPYAVGKLGLDAPIFVTLPVWRMGQMFMYDAFQAKWAQEDFTLFDLDDVDEAFSRITQLKFQQPRTLSGKGTGVVITPYSGGHMVGGTVWKIKKETEELKDAEEILYAVDFNHRKERHLNPTALPTLTRPSHLIIGASQALTRHTLKIELFEPIMETLKRGGNVLIPVDTAGRVVELGLLLEEAWTQQKITNYPLAILHGQAFNTFDFAKSMIEWMSDSVSNRFDLNRENPFHFKSVHLCHTRAEVDALPSPKVILASFPAMEIGFSLDLFLDWAENDKNLVLLVDRVQKGTLAHELKTMQGPMKLRRRVKRRVPLEGAELREWREAQRQREAEGRKNEGALVDAAGGAMDVDKTGMDSELSQEDEEDVYGHLPQQNVTVFPYEEPVRKWDDYGEVVDVRQFMIGENPGGLDNDEADDADPYDDGPPDQAAMAIEGMTDAEEELRARREVPTKCIVRDVEIVVRCEILTRDCAGLSDGRSLKELIAAVAPRRLIIIHGTEKESRAVQDMGVKGLGLAPEAVASPAERETVDVTSDTSVYRLRLDDAILSDLSWRRIADADVAYINGIVRVEKTEEREDVVLEPAEASVGHPTVYVGDVRLTEFRERLRRSSQALKTEFSSGLLYIENRESGSLVTIRKKAPGDFSLTAALSDDYFDVRDQFYSHFVDL